MDPYIVEGASLQFEAPHGADIDSRLAAQVKAAREYVKRHPALTPVDLDEFDTFMRFPKAFNKLVAASGEQL